MSSFANPNSRDLTIKLRVRYFDSVTDPDVLNERDADRTLYYDENDIAYLPFRSIDNRSNLDKMFTTKLHGSAGTLTSSIRIIFEDNTESHFTITGNGTKVAPFHMCYNVKDTPNKIIYPKGTVKLGWFTLTANSYDGTGTGGAEALGDLTDVTLTAVGANDILRYDGTSNQWENSYEPKPLGQTQNNIQFKTQWTGNVPASGEIMFLDALDANVGGAVGTATKVRFSDQDINNAGHLISDIWGDRTEYPLIVQTNPRDNATPIGLIAFSFSGARNSQPTYTEFPIATPFSFGVLGDGHPVVISFDGRIWDDDQIRALKSPSYAELYEGVTNTVIATPVLNTWYPHPNSVRNSSADFSDNLGILTYNNTATKQFKVTVSVDKFADQNDIRCNATLLKNGTPLPDNYQLVVFNKTGTNFSEKTVSKNYILQMAQNDTLQLAVRFSEDGATQVPPRANPTQITVENYRIVLNQIAY